MMCVIDVGSLLASKDDEHAMFKAHEGGWVRELVKDGKAPLVEGETAASSPYDTKRDVGIYEVPFFPSLCVPPLEKLSTQYVEKDIISHRGHCR